MMLGEIMRIGHRRKEPFSCSAQADAMICILRSPAASSRVTPETLLALVDVSTVRGTLPSVHIVQLSGTDARKRGAFDQAI